MALEQEKEILEPINKLEGIGETGRNVENELDNITQKVEGAIDKNARDNKSSADVIPLERPEQEDKIEAAVIRKAEKSLKDLETELGNKIAKTSVSEMEVILTPVFEQIAERFMDKELKDEDIASRISNIAYNTSKGDVGTYAWVLEKLESLSSEARTKHPIM